LPALGGNILDFAAGRNARGTPGRRNLDPGKTLPLPDNLGVASMRRSWIHIRRRACGAALALLLLAPAAGAQEAKDDTILLTICLRHDQSKPLDQINAQLRQLGYYKKFPPPGIEVASWYVMMGVG
jgi:hypothetical protein